MIGIALGVMVLITVLSVMNGFDYEIHNRIFGMTQQVTVSGLRGYVNADWQELMNKVDTFPKVKASAPFVSGQAMLNKEGIVRGVIITGIDPTLESKVSSIDKTMTSGSMTALQPGKFGIVIGQELAQSLDVSVGDKLVVITPQATATPVGVLPRFKRFNIVGIFHVGDGFGYDSSLVLINLNDAQKLMQMRNSVTGLRLKVDSLYDAPQVAEDIGQRLGAEYVVSDWTKDYGAYFKAIKMEKTTMFVVLMFIIMVAAFNLVSSLVMTVTDKQSDIAILRTLGASPKTIMGIFMVQGSIIGFIGTLAGIIFGILFALNAPAMVSGIEHLFHVHFISASLYFIDYLPSKLEWRDVINIGLITFVMSLLATIYPAWRASRIQPAEALRYE